MRSLREGNSTVTARFYEPLHRYQNVLVIVYDYYQRGWRRRLPRDMAVNPLHGIGSREGKPNRP